MRWRLAMVAVFFFSGVLSAAPEELRFEHRTSYRAERQLGAVFGFNDPVPALFGFNAAVNVFDFLRVTAGIGRFTSKTRYQGFDISAPSVTWGFGLRFLLPHRNLTPVLGASWATISTEGFPNESRHVYVAAGLEWQSSFGMNVGAGYNQSTNPQIGGLPYVNLGWYFGVL